MSDNDRKPADYVIYKGKAALQISLKAGQSTKIKTSNGEYTGTKKGVVFLAMARSLGEKSYDWENKITFGLNEHEIPKLINGLKGASQKFYHDRYMGDPEKEGQETKMLSVSLSDDKAVVFVNASEKKNGKENKIPGVPVTKDEALGLAILLERALVKVLGWD